MFPARVHRAIYNLLVTLLGGCMVCSTWASNLVWVLLGANWVFEGWSRPDGSNWHSTWREKWQMARKSKLLQAFVAFYLMMLVGMLWTSNIAAGWQMLQVRLPLLVVPLVMLTTRPITGRVRSVVLWLFSGTVLVVSVIAVVRMLTIPDLPYRDAVPYISHIRFALCCCMVVFFMCEEISAHHFPLSTLLSLLSVLIILWMLVFLVLIRSFTGLVVVALVATVLLFVRYRRWPLIVLWCIVVGVAAFFVVREVHSYYRLVPMAEQPLRELTSSGRPYEHACDGIIENGNYINNYVCRPELRAAWTLRSTLPYDSLTAGGFPVEPTLIRYLNACGLTKDSAGVRALTAADIDAVERGVANPVYEGRNPVRKMVYVMALEYEYHRHTNSVAGFTMLQRFEMWRATWHVVCEHPWLGVGTGDLYDAVGDELASMDSELSDTGKHTHNQYLAIMAMLGLLGFAVVLLLFIRPIFNIQHSTFNNRPIFNIQHSTFNIRPIFNIQHSTFNIPLMLAWLLTILISFLTEDTLDTLAGILFCTWFLAFRPQQEQ